jgi:hypothetical protein
MYNSPTLILLVLIDFLHFLGAGGVICIFWAPAALMLEEDLGRRGKYAPELLIFLTMSWLRFPCYGC